MTKISRIKKLVWDSGFFNFETAQLVSEEITSTEIILNNNYKKFKLIYVFSKEVLPQAVLKSIMGY